MLSPLLFLFSPVLSSRSLSYSFCSIYFSLFLFRIFLPATRPIFLLTLPPPPLFFLPLSSRFSSSLYTPLFFLPLFYPLFTTFFFYFLRFPSSSSIYSFLPLPLLTGPMLPLPSLTSLYCFSLPFNLFLIILNQLTPLFPLYPPILYSNPLLNSLFLFSSSFLYSFFLPPLSIILFFSHSPPPPFGLPLPFSLSSPSYQDWPWGRPGGWPLALHYCNATHISGLSDYILEEFDFDHRCLMMENTPETHTL